MSLLHTLVERTGIRHLPKETGEDGVRHYISAVQYTTELRRIELLPRRTINEMECQYLAKRMTELLKTNKGTMSLWPIQAIALMEIAEIGGAFCPVGVGMGKTLVSLLAPVVLESKNPVLLVPAALRDQTLAHVLPAMSKHWLLHSNLKVIGYSELSLEKNANMLNKIEPDLIVMDECHYIRHKQAGRTRRLVRYLRARPKTACVALSGTIANKSLKDWAHIAKWALNNNAPIPEKWQELSEWADALDVDVPDEQRPLPGALRKFCQTEGESIRAGFRRRLVETPGVIATKTDDLGCSLVVKKKNIAVPVQALRALEELRKTWETPNGDMLTQAIDVWRHARELALGFYYRWDPPAPREWMDARREWKRYAREVLKHNRRGLDTELQVWNESKRTPHPEWIEWKELKDTFKPNPVAEWISGFAVTACAEWLDTEEGIVWVEHRAFGEKLAELSGKPYFGAGDDSILRTDKKSIIASIGAHSEGKNLQRFSKNLVVVPPTSGKAWEQLLGRTHRAGQLADTVEVDLFLHVQELYGCFEKARSEAQYLEETYGHRQKLNYADIVI